MKTKVKCAHCGNAFLKEIGHVNRANKFGLRVYCNKVCSGLGRRHNKSKEELKVEKSWYDGFIREADRKVLKKKAAAYFKKDYAENPEKYRKWRKKRQPYHNEYCRQPLYKAYKKKYDQQYRAKKYYGKFWEAFIALRNLQGVVDNRQAKKDQHIFNKSQKRKRHAKSTKCQKLESCTVGIYQQS